MKIPVQIHAIQTGTVRIKTAQLAVRPAGPGGMVGVFADRNWSDWLPTLAFAIEHREGVIVVDTGQSAALLAAAERSLHPYLRSQVQFRVEPEDEIGPRLKALGIGPRDVARVVLTHLHIDHDAGLAHFPHSEILVAPGELRRARGIVGRLRGYLPQRWPGWFAPLPLALADGPLGPFAASQRLTKDGDVMALATPGHTADHLSVLVLEGDRQVLLAGDTSYDEALMLAGRVDGVSPDPMVSAATLKAIRQLAGAAPTVYLPTHDPLSAARLAARQAVPVAAQPGAQP